MDKPTLKIDQAGGRRILVVDDSAANREYLTAILEHYGYTVTAAHDGHQGLAVINKEQVDLVLLDFIMPGLDGLGVLKKLRSEHSNVELPVIMLTTQSHAENVVSCLQAGANDYIVKPYDMTVLLARVKAQIRVKEQGERQTGELHKLTKGPRQTPRSTRPVLRFCCMGCQSVLPGRGVATCPACNAQRPANGWKSILDSNWPWLGRKLGGRYHLEQFIGQGAVGQVYRASDIDLGRPFAIKIIDLAQTLDPDARELARNRMLVEIEALVRLSNPHSVRIYQVIWIEEDVWAMVMDFCKGTSLGQLVAERGRLAPGLALDLTYQVASALHEAHTHGILHRDIKPANIMVEQMTTGKHFARLLDFGLAHSLGKPQKPNEIAGTPEYIPPEALMDEEIDERSDIYSLGATLYHTLAGHPPFQGTNVSAVLMGRLYAPAPPLPEGLFPAAQSGALDALIARMMARAPEERFSSVEVLLSELTALLTTM